MSMRLVPSARGGSPVRGPSGMPTQPAQQVAWAKPFAKRHTIGTNPPPRMIAPQPGIEQRKECSGTPPHLEPMPTMSTVSTMSNMSSASSVPSTQSLHADSTPPHLTPQRSPERQPMFRKSISMTQLERPIADQHACASPFTCSATESQACLGTTLADVCANPTSFAHVLTSTQPSDQRSANTDGSILSRSISSPSMRSVPRVENCAERQVHSPAEAYDAREIFAAINQLKLEQEAQLEKVKHQLEKKFLVLKETLDGNVQLATTTASVVDDLSDRFSQLAGAFHNNSEKADVHSILGLVHQTQRELIRLSQDLATDRILRLGRSQIEVPPELTNMMPGAPMNNAKQFGEPGPSEYQGIGEETVASSRFQDLLNAQIAAHAELNNDQMSDMCNEVIDKMRSLNSARRFEPSGTHESEITCASDMYTNGEYASSGGLADIGNMMQQSIQRVELAFGKAKGLGFGDSIEPNGKQTDGGECVQPASQDTAMLCGQQWQGHVPQQQQQQQQQQPNQQLQPQDLQSTQSSHQLPAQPQVQQQRCSSTRGKPTIETIPEEPGDEALADRVGSQ